MPRPAYGVDAPGVVRNLALFGALGILLGTMGLLFGGWARLLVANYGFWAGGSLLVTAGAMTLSSLIGKRYLRDRLLRRLGLRGDERVLDAGCGRGLLLIGAAQRLPHGRAVGVDVWQAKDQSGNAQARTLANARLAGVAERVEVHSGDLRALPFADGFFDAAVSNLVLHNIPTREGRDQAVREIARVVRPGGQVVLCDFQKTGEMAATLAALGWTVLRSGLDVTVFPPVRVVAGLKP